MRACKHARESALQLIFTGINSRFFLAADIPIGNFAKVRITWAMIRLARLSLIAVVEIISAASGADPARLPADQLARAVRSDSISIPTPGELFAALEKPGKINWSGQYRPPMPMTYRNRAQIALNLGGLIADGFIAVEAKDSQQVKNIGSDIIKLAKALGVSEHVLSRGNSINEFAEHNEWDTLQEELEATQNEVKSSMQSHSDQDLIILVSLGGWIRGTQVVSGAILESYDAGSAKVLRQPALVGFMQSKIDEISPELRNEPLVKDVSQQLTGIQKLVSFPVGKAPSVDEVRKVNEAVGKVMEEIESKTIAK
ncbi:MAG: hypothetical protein DMF21_03900 [Verrucomicrobia bacterium]|nr:MAG: hypothetical protein DMF21_03900 [Verrucomicrobiota bacterium]